MTAAKPKSRQGILLGNEAIARGLIESGVQVMTSYPGTPSSEILPAVVRFAKELENPPYCEWSVNEKVAVEVALSASYTGKRTACCMKQVGLNVALDPVMSAAYIGVKGGFVLISADDPGPHSSQTEQDSRLLAHFAKLPVLDPDSPAHARDLIGPAFSLSEKYEIPVMLRPTLRVCHARQAITLRKPKVLKRPANFERNPFRWAAIPKMRLDLHYALNEKLAQIALQAEADKRFNIWHNPAFPKARLGILCSGVAAALARDVLSEMGLDVQGGPIPFLQVAMPYPLPLGPVKQLLQSCSKVLVLEETEPVLELLSPQRHKLLGRLSGHVPSAGEMTPDRLGDILERVLKQTKVKIPKPRGKVLKVPDQPPLRRPNLCPGCSHRAVFFAMRRAFPKGVFAGDIGCYTLGLNQGAVDTCHDMGASITFGSSLSRVFQGDQQGTPVVSTIGDSTFYHSGPAGLINAVYNGARFVLLILDNETTSMTGMQPTPENGLTADGHPGRKVDLLKLVKGCGVEMVEEVDPYDIPQLVKVLKKAGQYANDPKGSVAVIIARHACVAHRRDLAITDPVRIDVSDKCVACGVCTTKFNCPALVPNQEGKISVDRSWCVDCGLCLFVCPKGAIHRAEVA